MIQARLDFKPPVREPIMPTARKTRALLHALRAGYRFTVAGALKSLGIYALSQECGRLRRLGWDIKSEWYETPTARVKRYYL